MFYSVSMRQAGDECLRQQFPPRVAKHTDVLLSDLALPKAFPQMLTKTKSIPNKKRLDLFN